MVKFSTPRGTEDILPGDWKYWDFVIGQARDVALLFGYRRIETPTFAETSLFSRTSGVGSDIVDKEMYTFQDRDGDDLTLRPEGTAPVVRAYLQHGMHKLPQPVKLFYFERMFRYDRPQRGRLREHHQFGCEALGLDDAYVDVEMIALLCEFYARVGLTNLTLHLNSIGDQLCRPAYVADLVSYLRKHRDRLSERDKERLERNPLRVLDTKEDNTIPVLADAPRIIDYLCEECRSHWDKLRSGLDMLGIAYVVDPCLVRGLDYYTRTVFEFAPVSDARQSTVGSGGRYDVLSEAMGGPPVPGIGFGSGLERVVLNLKERNVEVLPEPHPDVYVAHIGDRTEEEALRLTGLIRKSGFSVDMAFGRLSMKAQMKRADGSGARVAVIVGGDELAAGRVILRDLVTGNQTVVPPEAIARVVTDALAS